MREDKQKSMKSVDQKLLPQFHSTSELRFRETFAFDSHSHKTHRKKLYHHHFSDINEYLVKKMMEVSQVKNLSMLSSSSFIYFRFLISLLANFVAESFFFVSKWESEWAIKTFTSSHPILSTISALNILWFPPIHLTPYTCFIIMKKDVGKFIN